MRLPSDTVVGRNAEGQPVTLAEGTYAAKEIQESLSLRLTTGACSSRLVDELAVHWCRMPQSFGAHALLVDVHEVLNQIGVIENARFSHAARTKPEEPFVGPLAGLWHKHWFQASFMFRNLIEEIEQRGMAPAFRSWERKYGKRGWDGRLFDEEMINLTTHAMVIDALENRAGLARRGAESRLTGEWIVFAKSRRRNIYLTLAGHGEPDDAILARCLPAAREYPELSQLKPFCSVGQPE